MAHADNSIIINQSSQAVYNFLADGLNNPKWRSGVVDISLKSGKAGSVGAEYRQVLKGPGGRQIDGDYRITEAVPGSRLAFVVTAGPARPEGLYILEPEGKSTKLSFSLDLKTKGLMKLMEPMINKTMQGEVANLSQLKQVLEQA